MRLTDKIQIQNKARISMTLMPLYRLFDKAQKGTGNFSILKNLDIHYLTFYTLTVIIDHSGDHHQFGAPMKLVEEILAEEVSSIGDDLSEKDAETGAKLILQELMNGSKSYKGHESEFYNAEKHQTEMYKFKLIELNRDENVDFIKLSKEGFMIYFCSDIKGIDFIKEFQAEMTRRFIERGDFSKASESLTQGKVLLREIQSRIANIRIKTDRSLVPKYDIFKEESDRIYTEFEKVLEDHEAVFKEIPITTNDGSVRDMQIKELERNCDDLNTLFAVTKQVVNQTRIHLRNRLEHRLNNSIKNAINLSFYDHILSELILLEPEELKTQVPELTAGILPARLPSIRSPYQIVKEKMEGLFAPIEEDLTFNQKDLEEEISTIEVKDDFYLDPQYDASFKSMIQEEIDKGKDVTLSYMINLCATEHKFNANKLKSLYIYILIQRLEAQRSFKKDDVENKQKNEVQMVDFKVTRLDKWIDVQDLYFGNDLKIEGINHE